MSVRAILGSRGNNNLNNHNGYLSEMRKDTGEDSGSVVMPRDMELTDVSSEM
jgi:hypothetical protein